MYSKACGLSTSCMRWISGVPTGLTLPLLTSASGEKLSKSTGNAVWLSPYKTSPFELYQHFVSTPDQIVHSWLKYFTFLSTEEIQEIIKSHQVCIYCPGLCGFLYCLFTVCNAYLGFTQSDLSQYKAQRCLAEHVTRLVHGGQFFPCMPFDLFN